MLFDFIFLWSFCPFGSWLPISSFRDDNQTYHTRWDSNARTIHEITQHSLQTEIHAPERIRAPNSGKREAADPRLRTRGHRDWPIRFTYLIFFLLTSRFNFNIMYDSHLSSDVPIRTDLQHNFSTLQSNALLSQQLKSVTTWYLYISIKICLFSKRTALSRRMFIFYGWKRVNRHFVGWSEINQNTRPAVSGEILSALPSILTRRKRQTHVICTNSFFTN
jgi:hypothetical protein